MPALMSLFLALWVLVHGRVTIHRLQGPMQFTDIYGVRRTGVAATGCTDGQPTIWIAPGVAMANLDHELAHAVDCLDDGILNGSPGSRPDVRPGWASDFCWDSDVEWYACAVVHDRSVHPGAVRSAPAQGLAQADPETPRSDVPRCASATQSCPQFTWDGSGVGWGASPRRHHRSAPGPRGRLDARRRPG